MKKFNFTLRLIFFSALILAVSVGLNAQQTNEWEFDGGPGIWTTVNTTAGTAAVTNGIYEYNVTAPDPYIMTAAFDPQWVVGDLKYLWIRMKNETADVSGEFFVFTASGFIHYPFTQSANDADFKDVYLDLSSNEAWVPTLGVNHFRIDPIGGNAGQTGTVSIDFIRISSVKPPPYAYTVTGLGGATDINGIGNTLQMAIEPVPSLGNTDATWTVDDESIATIDENGLLTAVAAGQVTVTATSKSSPAVSDDIVITINDVIIAVTGVEVVSSKYDLQGLGKTLQMSANVTPSNASVKNVEWSVDQPEVATIDAAGLLTSVSEGTVTVTATSVDDNTISDSKEIIIYTGQKNAWEFRYTLEGWTTINAGTNVVEDGVMRVDVTGLDPWVNGPAFVTPWSASNMDTLWLRIKNTTQDTQGQFYAFIDGGGFTAVTFPLTPEDTEYRDIKIDMTTNPDWTDNLKVSHFRLDPIEGNSTGSVYVDFIRFIETSPEVVWDNRPEVAFIDQYSQSFGDAWDDAAFYGQWDVVEPNAFTADDIANGYLQYVWPAKRILRSKNVYATPYTVEAILDYSAGSSRGGIVIRAEADGYIEDLQDTPEGDPGFNREGIAFYPTDDGASMIVQFTGPFDAAGTPVSRIQVPKPAEVTSLRDSNLYKIEDYGESVYVFVNDNPFIRIDLEGKTDTTYTSGTVYNSGMQVMGTFTDREVEITGKVGIVQRDAALRLYQVSIQTFLPWDNRPETSFVTHYEQVFKETWDNDTFYEQWDAAEPNSFAAADIANGYLQYVWTGKRLIRSKMVFDTSYVLEAILDYSAGSSRGGIVIRAEADGIIDDLQEPADGDPGFNREGIAFYPTDDGSAMNVQFTGLAGESGIPVTRIAVPKPADIVSLRDSASYRVEDYGASVYVFLNDNPFIRIDLDGKTEAAYTSGTVYNANMIALGTFSDMEIELSGKVAIAQRDAALRLYSASVKVVATVPGAPTIGAAAASGTSGTVTVAYIAPANNGGMPILSYTATSTPGDITGTVAQEGSGTITVSGLSDGTAYTFTVTATNAVGSGPASAASNAVTPATVPNPPTDVTATAENTEATISFTAPADNGGSEITGYTVTSTPDGFFATGTGSPIAITGLNSNTSYTFTVVATNAIGNSVESVVSNEVTTTNPVGIDEVSTSVSIYQRDNTIMIDLNNFSGKQTVSLYNLQGKLLISKLAYGGELLRLNERNVSSGVYLITIKGIDEIKQAKIMVR